MVGHLLWKLHCVTEETIRPMQHAVPAAVGYANDYVPAGELYDQIQKRKQIDVQDARFYTAEIVLILQQLRQEKASFDVPHAC